MRIAAVLLLAVTAWGQALDKETSFHVKLSGPIGAKASKPGARVGAVIISPERFLGGRLAGAVKSASSANLAGRVEVSFHTVLYKGRTWAVRSTVTEVVNSTGHPSVDEQERPVKVENGAVVSDHPDMLLDEGAELRLKVSPAAAPRP